MAVSRERLDQLYNELFGRTSGADEAGAEYWMESGLSGEALRDALIAGAQGADVTSFQQAQQTAAAGAARSPQRQTDVTKIYNELFGRNPGQAALNYWSGINLTGEVLRDQIAASAQEADAASFAERQAMLAAGQIPTGYAGNLLTGGGGADGAGDGGANGAGDGGTTTVPDWFEGYMDQYNAMNDRLNELTALLEQMQSSGGTNVSGVNVNQPGGTPTNQGATVVDDTGVYSSVGPAYSTAGDVSAAAYNPYRMPITNLNLTPEMMDAYRFQQY